MYKALFTDIDGVLKLESPQSVLKPFDSYAIEGLKLFKNNGMIIAYSSGKSANYIENCVKLSGLEIEHDFINGENGAVIRTSNGYEILGKYSDELEFLRKRINESLDGTRKLIKIEPKEATLTYRLDKQLDLEEFSNHIMKIITLTGLNLDPVYGYGQEDNYVDIIQKGVNKVSGMETFSERTKIPLEQMIGIGDGLNDKSFLERVGFPAAPSNARDEVKSLVRSRNGYVANNSVGEGVLEIAKYFLNL